MRIAAFILTFFLLSETSFAQKDKVYLSNGSVLVGSVKMNATNDSVAVSIINQTALFAISDIDAISIRKDGFRANYTNKTKLAVGYFGSVKISSLITNQDGSEGTLHYGVSTHHGYQFSPLLNLSVGIAYNTYLEYNSVPVFARYHAQLNKSRFNTYAFAEAGYGFVNSKKVESFGVSGGRFLHAGLGLQKRLLKNYISIEAGVQLQKIREATSAATSLFEMRPTTGASGQNSKNLVSAVLSVSYVW